MGKPPAGRTSKSVPASVSASTGRLTRVSRSPSPSGGVFCFTLGFRFLAIMFLLFGQGSVRQHSIRHYTRSLGYSIMAIRASSGRTAPQSRQSREIARRKIRMILGKLPSAQSRRADIFVARRGQRHVFGQPFVRRMRPFVEKWTSPQPELGGAGWGCRSYGGTKGCGRGGATRGGWWIVKSGEWRPESPRKPCNP